MKGQTAFEFMLVIALGMFVIALVQWQYIQYRNAFQEETTDTSAQQLAAQWANEIQDVSHRPGFQVPMQVPSALAGQESFILRLTNTSAEVSWQNHTAISTFANTWVTNQTGDSDFVLVPGSYVIQTRTDKVMVNATG